MLVFCLTPCFESLLQKALVFLKETDGLLKIEDILPFFPDFTLIDDDFKVTRKIRMAQGYFSAGSLAPFYVFSVWALFPCTVPDHARHKLCTRRASKPIKSFRMISQVAKPNNIGQNNFKVKKFIFSFSIQEIIFNHEWQSEMVTFSTSVLKTPIKTTKFQKGLKLNYLAKNMDMQLCMRPQGRSTQVHFN
ncbi:hypothetical protein YC2023_076683 [Brassica napus]